MYELKRRPDYINTLNYYIDKYYQNQKIYENNNITPSYQINTFEDYDLIKNLNYLDIKFISSYYNNYTTEDNVIVSIKYSYEWNLEKDIINPLFILKYKDGTIHTIIYNLNEYEEYNLKIVDIFDNIIEDLINYFIIKESRLNSNVN